MPFIAEVLSSLISIFLLVLIINIVLGWLYHFNVVNRGNQFVDTVYRLSWQLTDPVMRPIRRFIPAFQGIDFSPILVFVVLNAVQSKILLPLSHGASFPSLF